MSFDVKKAVKAWKENYPERGERIVVLRGLFFHCQTERKVRRRGQTEKVTYPQTAENLRLMLAEEGVKV